MATHSNILAWEIPWTEEAGGQLIVPAKSGKRLENTHIDTEEVLVKVGEFHT